MLVIKIQPSSWKKMRRPGDLAEKADAPADKDDKKKPKKKDEDDEEGDFEIAQPPVPINGVN